MQAMSLLADLAFLSETDSVFVVDEPELNLNLLVAQQLWDAIERLRPEAVFVYVTHSLAFAMRPTVEAIRVLPGDEWGEILRLGPRVARARAFLEIT